MNVFFFLALFFRRNQNKNVLNSWFEREKQKPTNQNVEQI